MVLLFSNHRGGPLQRGRLNLKIESDSDGSGGADATYIIQVKGTAVVQYQLSIKGDGSSSGAGTVSMRLDGGSAILKTCTITAGVVDDSALCTNDAVNGTEYKLTATPDLGSVFDGWSGDCSGSTNPCDFIPTADAEVTAAFSLGQPAIQVKRDTTGDGSFDRDFGTGYPADDDVGTLVSLAQQTLTYEITNNGTADLNVTNISTDGANNVTVDSITDILDGGGNPVADPASIPLIAPGSTTKFKVNYTPHVPTDTVGAFNFDLKITSDIQGDSVIKVEGTVELNYQLTIAGVGNGEVEWTDGVTGDPAETCTIANATATGECTPTITNATYTLTAKVSVVGWEFDSWSGGCTGNTNPCEFTPSTDGANVTATFTAVQYQLSIKGAGTGNGAVTGKLVTPAKTTVILCGVVNSVISPQPYCDADIDAGMQVRLTTNVGSTATGQSVFGGWSGCDEVQSDDSCIQTVAGGDEEVIAHFNLENDAELDVERDDNPVADGSTDTLDNHPVEPKSVVYTLLNSGTEPLTLNSISLKLGENIKSLSLGSFDREVIPAGEEAIITIEYEPATVGDFSFEIEIASSDEDESPYNIEVKGTAEAVQPDDEPIVEQTRTSHIIHNFLTRRADIITTNDPDLTSRLTGRATGGDRGDGSFGLTGDGISTRMNFSAATSLSRLMRPPSMPPQGRLMVGELSGGGSGGSGYGIAKSSGAVDLLDPLSLGSSTNGLTPNANLSGEQAYGLVPDPDAPKPHEGPQAGAVHDPSQSPGLPLNLTPGAEPPADSGPAFDVWMKTTFAYHDGGDEGNGAAAAGLLFVGADYLVDQYAVVGMLAQLDWMEEENKSENYSVEGIGWMVGPYLVTQLFDEVMLDARFAYGLSSNDINPEGTYEDTFETTRWLARAQLTGQIQVGRLSVKPHVRVLYFEEMQEAYTDSSVDQKLVAEQTISLGRVSFGPTVSYQHTTDRGITIEPSLGIQGLWDFEPGDLVDLDSGLSYESAVDIRARVEAGLTLSEAKGLSISVSSFYDGIGVGDVESYGGSFAVRIPLN